VAPRKKKPAAAALPGIDTATPEAVGRTLADYAARVIRVLSKLGYEPIESRNPNAQEWAKYYYESDGSTTHRVTLIIPTDTAGLSPVKIENVVITTQRVLPPDAERWIAASGSTSGAPSLGSSVVGLSFAQASTGLITSRAAGTQPGPVQASTNDPYQGPFARDVAYLLRALDIETRGSVVDMYTCTICKNPTDSWKLGTAGEILCPTCF